MVSLSNHQGGHTPWPIFDRLRMRGDAAQLNSSSSSS
jgi:hypothetical protein